MEVGACFIRSDICMRPLYAGLITNIAMRRYNARMGYMHVTMRNIAHGFLCRLTWLKSAIFRRSQFGRNPVPIEETHGGCFRCRSRRSKGGAAFAVQIGSSVVRAFAKWATSVRVTFVLNCWVARLPLECATWLRSGSEYSP